MSIHAPAVGVDAAATPGSAGSAVASYQRSIVRTEFVADVFDWTIPNRVAPLVVTIIWPTTLFAGRLTASVVNVPAAGAVAVVPEKNPPMVTPAPPWLNASTPAEAMSRPTFVRSAMGTPASRSLSSVIAHRSREPRSAAASCSASRRMR
jgi:hypothetical protein